MPSEPLAAHSPAEAKLYLLATPCPRCGRGPVRSTAERFIESHGPETTLAITARCDACGHEAEAHFTVPTASAGDPTEAINATAEPSRILDVGRWVMLATMLIEAARSEKDAVRARQLKIEAGLCLDEALKFYTDADNDLPPPEAFFSDTSRTPLHEAPERFSRRRLEAMRQALPRSSTNA